MNILAFIAPLPLFTGLTTEEKNIFVQAARLRACKKDTVLFMHGDPATHVYMVVKGAVKLHRQTPDGKDIALQIAITGDLVAEHDLLEHKKLYQMSATTTEETTLLEYPMWFFREQLKTCHDLSLNLLAAISRKSSRSTIDSEHLLTLKAPQRVGCFLMRLCDIHGFDTAHFTLPYNKSTIASKLGMEPESFSRALAKLKEIGVSVVGNEVFIADLEPLEQYVCSHCSVFLDCETSDSLHTRRISAGYPQQA